MAAQLTSFPAASANPGSELPSGRALTRRRIRLFSVIAAFLCLHAQIAASAEWTTLSVGHNGIAKVSRWVPVNIQAAELPSDQSVELVCDFSSPRGDRFLQTVASGKTDSAGRIDLSGYFIIGRQEGTGVVSIVGSENGEVLLRQAIVHSEDVETSELPDVATQLRVHRLDVPFLMTYGDLTGIPELLRNAKQYSANQQLLEGLVYPDIQSLPEDVRGYDGIQLLLLADEFDCNDAQASAIREWVLRGGNLFVSAGGQVNALTSAESLQWLTELFAVQPDPFSIRDLTQLQSFVAAADPGVTALRSRRERDGIKMSGFGTPEMIVDVKSLNGPILGRMSYGGGVIQFLGVDVNQKPLRQWNSLPQFYEVLLLGGRLSAATTAQSRTARISQAGVSDLGSQLMATVDARSENSQWSTWSVMGMVVAYLLLIGPFDYALVTLLLKRPGLTWITFPCWVVAGAVALFVVTDHQSGVRSSHLNVIDVMPHESGEAIHLRSWISLQPKQTLQTDLSAEIDESFSMPSHGLPSLRWAGRPEDVFGGMYRVGGVGLGQRAFSQNSEQLQTLKSIPMLIDGSREVYVDSFSESDEPSVVSNLNVMGNGLLSGELTNNLPFDISDWMIIYGNRVYRPRGERDETMLMAKSTFDTRGGRLFASDLRTFLNASKLVLDEKKGKGAPKSATQVSTPYNKQSLDPMYILTMASFYELAGGSEYVGLGNSLLSGMEVSDTSRLNHAVLIGRSDVEATSIKVKGMTAPSADTETVMRLFLPVQRRQKSMN